MGEQIQNQFVSDNYSEVIGDLEKKKQKREKDAKQKEFELKIEQLADKAIEFRQKRGEEDGMTILLENFLDVALQMRSIMETMSAINVAMECISDSIGFLDAAIEFDNVLMDESLKNNYGFFARLKANRKMKKTIRNNCGRMMQIAQGLSMKYKLANDMMKAMSKVGDKLKASIGKAKLKAEKKAKKSGNAVSIETPAQKLIKERMSSRGIANVSPAKPNDSSSGIDDII